MSTASEGHIPPPLDPRYPAGRFHRPDPIPRQALDAAIAQIAALPAHLASALEGLTDAQLDTPYRDGGWTVRQLVHHIADSHINAFSRVRLALTEDAPTIYGYDEKAWAMLPDSSAPVAWSLGLLTGLHARWAMLLERLSPAQWQRTFLHPERGAMSVELASLLYGWHCVHHVAHITRLRADKGW